MAIKYYHDFVIVADGVGSNAAGLVKSFRVRVFDSPAGQGEFEEAVAVPDDLHDRLRWLEGRDLDEDEEAQMDVGEALASLILPEYARRLFAGSLARIGDGEGLRLRLRLADELSHLPWEYLYIPEGRGERTSGGFLALDPRISVARHEALAVPGDWFRGPSSRRVLVAMATPEPHDRYNKLSSLPVEQRELKGALGGVAGIEPVYAPEYGGGGEAGGTIAGLTVKGLLAALMERTDVFHFSGHGEFDQKTGGGSIVLADENNRAATLPADRLAEVLRGRGVRLVVLGACETGRRDGRNVWGSVATALLKAGIPAVVAMQFTVNDSLAAAFSGAFYRALIAGLMVDEAVSAGRLAMRIAMPAASPHIRDWGVPVLYLRAPGGTVFNPVSDERAAKAAKEEHGHLVSQQLRSVSASGRVLGAAIGNLRTGTVKIDQKVKENVSGFVIGGYAVNVEGGRLIIRQEADTVDGTLIGLALENVGGTPPAQADDRSALERVQELLGVSGTPDAAAKFCQSCGEKNGAAAKFCKKCGDPIE